MKKLDKKAQPNHYRGDARELMKNYDLFMKEARRIPKVYYSRKGEMIKSER